MGFVKFNQLIEKYIIELEDLSSRNKECHPSFTLLKNAYRNIAFYSYMIYFSFFLFGLLIIAPFLWERFEFLLDNLLWYLVFVSFISLIIFIVCRAFKFPYLNDLWALGDRVILVRGKIQLFEFDFEEIKGMIKDTVNISNIEAIAYLRRYFQLIEPTFKDENNAFANEFSKPLERFLAFHYLVDIEKLSIDNEELNLLMASLLRIGKGQLKNYNTVVNTFKIKQINEYSENDWKRIESNRQKIEHSYEMLNRASLKIKDKYDLLDKTK